MKFPSGKIEKELSDFMEKLSDEVIQAAWKAEFFVCARVDGFEEFLVPVVQRKTGDLEKDTEEWLRCLKTFVAGYKSDSAGQVN